MSNDKVALALQYGRMKQAELIQAQKDGKLKWKHIIKELDEELESSEFEVDHDRKSDSLNVSDHPLYADVIERYEARQKARKMYLQELRPQKLQEKKNSDGDEDDSKSKPVAPGDLGNATY